MGATSSSEPSEVYVERSEDKEAYNVVHVTDNVMRRLAGPGKTTGKTEGKENQGEKKEKTRAPPPQLQQTAAVTNNIAAVSPRKSSSTRSSSALNEEQIAHEAQIAARERALHESMMTAVSETVESVDKQVRAVKTSDACVEMETKVLQCYESSSRFADPQLDSSSPTSSKRAKMEDDPTKSSESTMCCVIYNSRERRHPSSDMETDAQEEEFFKISSKDTFRMQAHLTQSRRTLTDRAMVSQQIVAQHNEQRRATAWPHSIVRVILPNNVHKEGEDEEKRFEMQLCVPSTSSINSIYLLIAETLKIAGDQFKLTIPPTLRLRADDGESLQSARLAPSTTVVMSFGDASTKISMSESSVVSYASAERIAHLHLSINSSYTPFDPLVDDVKQEALQGVAGGSSMGGTKMGPIKSGGVKPKWFGKR